MPYLHPLGSMIRPLYAPPLPNDVCESTGRADGLDVLVAGVIDSLSTGQGDTSFLSRLGSLTFILSSPQLQKDTKPPNPLQQIARLGSFIRYKMSSVTQTDSFPQGVL